MFKANSVRSVNSVLWNEHWNDSGKSATEDGGKNSADQRGNLARYVVPQLRRVDKDVFTAKQENQENSATGAKGFLTLVDQNNQKIRTIVNKRKSEEQNPGSVNVPALIGLSAAAAAASLNQSSLKVIAVAQEFSADVPKGCVTAQFPAGGTVVVRNSGVKIVISKGADSASAPEQKKSPVAVKSHNDINRNRNY